MTEGIVLSLLFARWQVLEEITAKSYETVYYHTPRFRLARRD